MYNMSCTIVIISEGRIALEVAEKSCQPKLLPLPLPKKNVSLHLVWEEFPT